MYTPSERRCFFCNSQGLKECPGKQFDGTYFECVICGKYRLAGSFIETFEEVLGRRQAAKFSHLLAEQKFRNKEQKQAFTTYDVDKFLQTYPNETEIPARILESLRIRKETLNLGSYDDVEVDLRVKAGNDWSWNTRWAYADNEQTFLNVVESLCERYGIKVRIDMEQNKAYFNIAPYFERIERKMNANEHATVIFNGNVGQAFTGDNVAFEGTNNQTNNISNGVNIQYLNELIEELKCGASVAAASLERFNEAFDTLQKDVRVRQDRTVFSEAVKFLNSLRTIVGLGNDITDLVVSFNQKFLA